MGFPGSSVVKNTPANAGDTGDAGSILGLGRSPGGGNGNPLQYSCLENPIDSGTWQATVRRVAESQTLLSTWAHMHMHVCMSNLICQFIPVSAAPHVNTSILYISVSFLILELRFWFLHSLAFAFYLHHGCFIFQILITISSATQVILSSWQNHLWCLKVTEVSWRPPLSLLWMEQTSLKNFSTLSPPHRNLARLSTSAILGSPLQASAKWI